MYCTHCGAEIDPKDASCPYCGYLNPYGAERKYMKELEVIRTKTDELDDHPENYVKAEVKKKGRTAGVIFLTVLAVIVGLTAFFTGAAYLLDKLAHRDSAREEMAFRDRYIPELNQMIEEGRENEAWKYMVETLYDEKGSSYLFNWEHYDYLSAYGSVLFVREVREMAEAGQLTEDAFTEAGATILGDIKNVDDLINGRAAAEDIPKIREIYEEEERFLTETIGMTESEMDEIYNTCNKDGWASYTDLKKELKKYWDKVPDELKKR